MRGGGGRYPAGEGGYPKDDKDDHPYDRDGDRYKDQGWERVRRRSPRRYNTERRGDRDGRDYTAVKRAMEIAETTVEYMKFGTPVTILSTVTHVKAALEIMSVMTAGVIPHVGLVRPLGSVRRSSACERS